MDVTVNDMPADVPYSVSLDGVEPSSNDDAASADTSADASAE